MPVMAMTMVIVAMMIMPVPGMVMMRMIMLIVMIVTAILARILIVFMGGHDGSDAPSAGLSRLSQSPPPRQGAVAGDRHPG